METIKIYFDALYGLDKERFEKVILVKMPIALWNES